MRTGIPLLMSLALLLGCQSTPKPNPPPGNPRPASTDKHIEVIFEPSANLPGIADNMDVNGELVFNSFTQNRGSYEPFEISFAETDVSGAINFAASSSHTVSAGRVIFASQPWPNASNPKAQRVRIKWFNVAHPAEGYKYAITMRGQTLDPRVRPR